MRRPRCRLRTKGAPVKIIAPILQTNGFAIISLEETGIATPKDLIGKRLAVQPGTAQTTLLDAILASNKIDKTKVDIINIDPAAPSSARCSRRRSTRSSAAPISSRADPRARLQGQRHPLSRRRRADGRVSRSSPATTGSRPMPISTQVRRGEPAGLGRGAEEPRRGGRRGRGAVPRGDEGADPEAARRRPQAALRARARRRSAACPTRTGRSTLRPADAISAAAQGQADHRLLHDRVPAGHGPVPAA